MWISPELQAMLDRAWQGKFCLMEDRFECMAAARYWEDHPDFAPPRYGYGNPADAAIRQAIGPTTVRYNDAD